MNVGNGASSSGSSVRMTIRMPYATSQLFETASASRAAPVSDTVAPPPSRYVRQTSLRPAGTARQTQPVGATAASSARVRFAGSADIADRSEGPVAKRRRKGGEGASHVSDDSAAPRSRAISPPPARQARRKGQHNLHEPSEGKSDLVEEESPIASRTRRKHPDL